MPVSTNPVSRPYSRTVRAVLAGTAFVLAGVCAWWIVSGFAAAVAASVAALAAWRLAGVYRRTPWRRPGSDSTPLGAAAPGDLDRPGCSKADGRDDGLPGQENGMRRAIPEHVYAPGERTW